MQAESIHVFFITIEILTFIWWKHQMDLKSAKKINDFRIQMVADLHDNLSSRLYALKIIIDQLDNPFISPQRRKSLSASLKNLGDSSILAIRSIMWSFDPKTNTLHALVEKMKDFSTSTIGSITDEKLNNLLSDQEVRIPIDPQRANHLLMAFQEILINMIKHTRPESIHSQIYLQANCLHLQIQNTFALVYPTTLPPLPGEATSRESYGVENLTNRIQALGGSFQFAENLDGQNFQLSVPFDAKSSRLEKLLKSTSNVQHRNY
jgi:signal transduction histidine kinase